MPDNVRMRMDELMVPIDMQIARCINNEELLMLACGMLQRSKELFDCTINEAGRKEMFKDYI
jgi:hypothetical protein